MSREHALLTARDIHGPLMQMFTNLQGENGTEWLDILKKVNRRQNPFPEIASRWLLAVTPNLTFAERIERGGYTEVNNCITEERLPITRDQFGEWEWRLFHFNCDITSEDAINRMKAAEFEPAQIGHLLAFGEIFPEAQRKFPVIGLGSIVENTEPGKLRNWVPGIGCDYPPGGELNLHYFDDWWGIYYRFLGVRRRQAA